MGVRYVWGAEKMAQKARLVIAPGAPVVNLSSGKKGYVVKHHPESRSGVLVQWDGEATIAHMDREYLGAP